MGAEKKAQLAVQDLSHKKIKQPPPQNRKALDAAEKRLFRGRKIDPREQARTEQARKALKDILAVVDFPEVKELQGQRNELQALLSKANAAVKEADLKLRQPQRSVHEDAAALLEGEDLQLPDEGKAVLSERQAAAQRAARYAEAIRMLDTKIQNTSRKVGRQMAREARPAYAARLQVAADKVWAASEALADLEALLSVLSIKSNGRGGNGLGAVSYRSQHRRDAENFIARAVAEHGLRDPREG